MVREGGIYAIVQLSTGLRYIGSSVYIANRWARHRMHLRRGDHHNGRLQRSWNKYSEEDFRFEVIEFAEPEDLLTVEQRWLDTSPWELFNMRKIAHTSRGVKHTPELCKNFSIARKKIWAERGPPPNFREAQLAYAIGSKHSEETKAKMSKSHSGRKKSDEQNAAASARMKLMPQWDRDRRTAKLCRDWTVVSPEGVATVIHDLKRFCKANGLLQGHMSSVAAGKRKHHKGWTVKKHYDDEPATENFDGLKRTLEIIS